MRQPHAVAFAVVAAAAMLGAFALPAAAQKKAPTPAPVAKGAPAPPVTKAAPPSAGPTRIDVNAVAARAGLDAATRARVAPHIEAMNAERARMHALTASVTPNTPAARKERIHTELNARFKSFAAHWSQASAGMSPKQKEAFDAAIREQMGTKPRAVGNPHSKLPAMHPKLAPNGGPAKK